jgi:hypothetical protein
LARACKYCLYGSGTNICEEVIATAVPAYKPITLVKHILLVIFAPPSGITCGEGTITHRNVIAAAVGCN